MQWFDIFSDNEHGSGNAQHEDLEDDAERIRRELLSVGETWRKDFGSGAMGVEVLCSMCLFLVSRFLRCASNISSTLRGAKTA